MTPGHGPAGSATNDSLVSFVRDTLGCGCPAEVLADIQVERAPAAFAGLPVAALLRVGGRLLVVLCAGPQWQQVSAHLAAVASSARQLRDTLGFNRTRLVVASDEPAAEEALMAGFAALRGQDDHIHLHVIPCALVPDVAVASLRADS